MIRRKNALFAHFHGKLATTNISREMSPFLFNLNFLNNKKIYQKQKINQKKIFSKKVLHSTIWLIYLVLMHCQDSKITLLWFASEPVNMPDWLN